MNPKDLARSWQHLATRRTLASSGHLLQWLQPAFKEELATPTLKRAGLWMKESARKGAEAGRGISKGRRATHVYSLVPATWNSKRLLVAGSCVLILGCLGLGASASNYGEPSSKFSGYFCGTHSAATQRVKQVVQCVLRHSEAEPRHQGHATRWPDVYSIRSLTSPPGLYWLRT